MSGRQFDAATFGSIAPAQSPHHQPRRRRSAGASNGLHFTVATSLQEVMSAWNLVYRAYRRAGLIESNAAELHTSPATVHEYTAVVAGCIGPVAASTLSAYLDYEAGLPLDAVYPEELTQRRQAGRRLCEVGLFADRRQQQQRSADSLFDLMRFGYHYAVHQGADDIVIGVHPRHAGFYCRLVGFEQIGPERQYATVNGNAVVLLSLALDEAPYREKLPRGLRYFYQYPVADDTYDSRVRLTPGKIAGTPLEAYAPAVQ